MEKFTKGEWLVHVNPQRDEIFIGMDSFNKDPYDYYTAHKVEISCVDEEAIANAHLIAAAPKMYSLIYDLRRSILDTIKARDLAKSNSGITEIGSDTVAEDFFNIVDNVLKEARGEHE